jgi:ribosomal protein L35AE/L33A
VKGDREFMLAMRGTRLELEAGSRVECYDRGTGETMWRGKVRSVHPKSGRILVWRDGGKQPVPFTAYGDSVSVFRYVPERWRLRAAAEV